MKFLNKPISITSNEFIRNLKTKQEILNKACYCGRLDPMARGQMLILEGDECKQMKNYLKNDKEYEFEIIVGYSTDTDDILELFEDKLSLTKKLDTQICLIDEVIHFKNLKIQKFHKYSSFVLRKNDIRYPLWKWHNLGLLLEEEIPTKNINIHSIEFLQKKTYEKSVLLNTFIDRIQKINNFHNFRQKEIIEQWKQELLSNEQQPLIHSFKFRFKVSSGFYIRQFINDLKRKIKMPLLVFDIHRTKIYV